METLIKQIIFVCERGREGEMDGSGRGSKQENKRRSNDGEERMISPK